MYAAGRVAVMHLVQGRSPRHLDLRSTYKRRLCDVLKFAFYQEIVNANCHGSTAMGIACEVQLCRKRALC